jgi:hypothetical protein
MYFCFDSNSKENNSEAGRHDDDYFLLSCVLLLLAFECKALVHGNKTVVNLKEKDDDERED